MPESFERRLLQCSNTMYARDESLPLVKLFRHFPTNEAIDLDQKRYASRRRKQSSSRAQRYLGQERIPDRGASRWPAGTINSPRNRSLGQDRKNIIAPIATIQAPVRIMIREWASYGTLRSAGHHFRGNVYIYMYDICMYICICAHSRVRALRHKVHSLRKPPLRCIHVRLHTVKPAAKPLPTGVQPPWNRLFQTIKYIN